MILRQDVLVWNSIRGFYHERQSPWPICLYQSICPCGSVLGISIKVGFLANQPWKRLSTISVLYGKNALMTGVVGKSSRSNAIDGIGGYDKHPTCTRHFNCLSNNRGRRVILIDAHTDTHIYSASLRYATRIRGRCVRSSLIEISRHAPAWRASSAALSRWPS